MLLPTEFPLFLPPPSSRSSFTVISTCEGPLVFLFQGLQCSLSSSPPVLHRHLLPSLLHPPLPPHLDSQATLACGFYPFLLVPPIFPLCRIPYLDRPRSFGLLPRALSLSPSFSPFPTHHLHQPRLNIRQPETGYPSSPSVSRELY